MEINEKVISAVILEWFETVSAMTDALDSIEQALHTRPESPLNEAAWALIGSYIRAIDAKYNIGPWLDWFWTECRLGESPMHASLPGESLRAITGIDDLIKLIIDDLRLSVNNDGGGV